MKRGRILLWLIIVSCYPLALSAEPQSAAPSPANSRALLEANGTEDLAAQAGPVAAQQLSAALHRTNSALPARADAVVMDVVVSYLRRQADHDHVAERLIPIY